MYPVRTLFERSSIFDFQSPKVLSENPSLKKFSLKFDHRLLAFGHALLTENGEFPFELLNLSEEVFVFCGFSGFAMADTANRLYQKVMTYKNHRILGTIKLRKNTSSDFLKPFLPVDDDGTGEVKHIVA